MDSMQWPLTGAVMLIAFLVATLLADALRPRWRALPVLALGLLLGGLFLEWTRFDHGHRSTLFWIGWLIAPLVTIFGGAAWGARRFYGWPDLGVHPPRAGSVATFILLGVLIGSQLHAKDVSLSQQTLDDLLARSASESEITATLTHMGAWDPPHFARCTDATGQTLWGFPAGGEAWLARPVEKARWQRHWATDLQFPGVAP